MCIKAAHIHPQISYLFLLLTFDLWKCQIIIIIINNNCQINYSFSESFILHMHHSMPITLEILNLVQNAYKLKLCIVLPPQLQTQ